MKCNIKAAVLQWFEFMSFIRYHNTHKQHNMKAVLFFNNYVLFKIIHSQLQSKNVTSTLFEMRKGLCYKTKG